MLGIQSVIELQQFAGGKKIVSKKNVKLKNDNNAKKQKLLQNKTYGPKLSLANIASEEKKSDFFSI